MPVSVRGTVSSSCDCVRVVWAFLCECVEMDVRQSVRPASPWSVINRASCGNQTVTHIHTHTYIHTHTFTLIYSTRRGILWMLLSSEKPHFLLTVSLAFLCQKWAAAYERPSPTVHPTNSSLAPPPPLGVMAFLFSVRLSLGISASVFSLLFIIHIFSPLSPPFSYSLPLFYYLSFSLSFCPPQANPQTSIRSKQGSLTFNFLLATHFSIVCASPPFLGLFLCELNRWMDVVLDE